MSTPARDLIIANVVSTLDAITAGQTPAGSSTTYNTTPTVELASRESGDPDAAPRPWIGVVPAPVQPPPEELCFGYTDERLQIQLVCHVDGATPSAKSSALAQLGDDITAALFLDNSRGGHAYRTTITQQMAGDEARPASESVDSGSTSGIGSGTMMLEIRFERTNRLTPA